MFISKSANRNAGAGLHIQRSKIIQINTSTHNEEVNFWNTLFEWETTLHRRYNNAFTVAMENLTMHELLAR